MAMNQEQKPGERGFPLLVLRQQNTRRVTTGISPAQITG